jgi:hypothetical protein
MIMPTNLSRKSRDDLICLETWGVFFVGLEARTGIRCLKRGAFVAFKGADMFAAAYLSKKSLVFISSACADKSRISLPSKL